MMLKIDISTRTIQRFNFDYHYTEDSFANKDAYDFHHRVWIGKSPQATVIHDHGFVVAIVFPEYYAWSEQDSLDAAADSGKLDFLQIQPSELADYEVGKDDEGNPEYEGIINLGNASEPFDSENLDYFQVPVELFAKDPVIAKVIADNPQED